MGEEIAQRTQGTNVFTITPVLELRASNDDAVKPKEKNEKEADRPNVRWEQDVVDNEDMGKKKTKICCIYHPPDEEEGAEPEFHFHDRPSDSDSDSSSSSSSEDDRKNGYNFDERRRRRIERRHRKLRQNPNPDPNAYEFQPDYTHRRQGN